MFVVPLMNQPPPLVTNCESEWSQYIFGAPETPTEMRSALVLDPGMTSMPSRVATRTPLRKLVLPMLDAVSVLALRLPKVALLLLMPLLPTLALISSKRECQRPGVAAEPSGIWVYVKYDISRDAHGGGETERIKRGNDGCVWIRNRPHKINTVGGVGAV